MSGGKYLALFFGSWGVVCHESKWHYNSIFHRRPLLLWTLHHFVEKNGYVRINHWATQWEGKKKKQSPRSGYERVKRFLTSLVSVMYLTPFLVWHLHPLSFHVIWQLITSELFLIYFPVCRVDTDSNDRQRGINQESHRKTCIGNKLDWTRNFMSRLERQLFLSLYSN